VIAAAHTILTSIVSSLGSAVKASEGLCRVGGDAVSQLVHHAQGTIGFAAAKLRRPPEQRQRLRISLFDVMLEPFLVETLSFSGRLTATRDEGTHKSEE
jgi:hypothetical protein